MVGTLCLYIDLRTRDFRNAFRWDKILYTNRTSYAKETSRY